MVVLGGDADRMMAKLDTDPDDLVSNPAHAALAVCITSVAAAALCNILHSTLASRTPTQLLLLFTLLVQTSLSIFDIVSCAASVSTGVSAGADR